MIIILQNKSENGTLLTVPHWKEIDNFCIPERRAQPGFLIDAKLHWLKKKCPFLCTSVSKFFNSKMRTVLENITQEQAALNISCGRCIKHVKDSHTATTKPCPNLDSLACIFLYHLVKNTNHYFWYYISVIFDCNFTTANKCWEPYWLRQ